MSKDSKDLIKFNMYEWSQRDSSSWIGRLGAWFTITAPMKSFYGSDMIRKYNQQVKALKAERADADGNSMLT